MHDLSLIEQCYQHFIVYWPELLPDGIGEINLKSLSSMDLLNFHHHKKINDDTLTRTFHVVETKEKITLINDEFIIWITPDPNSSKQLTTVLVSLNKQPLPTLEAGFQASGVYNTSTLVLSYLERLLAEIHENEEIIKNYQNTG